LNKHFEGIFVVMLSNQDLELKRIDHLGIVAGIIDSIGVVEIVNNFGSSIYFMEN